MLHSVQSAIENGYRWSKTASRTQKGFVLMAACVFVLVGGLSYVRRKGNSVQHEFNIRYSETEGMIRIWEGANWILTVQSYRTENNLIVVDGLSVNCETKIDKDALFALVVIQLGIVYDKIDLNNEVTPSASSLHIGKKYLKPFACDIDHLENCAGVKNNENHVTIFVDTFNASEFGQKMKVFTLSKRIPEKNVMHNPDSLSIIANDNMDKNSKVENKSNGNNLSVPPFETQIILQEETTSKIIKISETKSNQCILKATLGIGTHSESSLKYIYVKTIDVTGEITMDGTAYLFLLIHEANRLYNGASLSNELNQKFDIFRIYKSDLKSLNLNDQELSKKYESIKKERYMTYTNISLNELCKNEKFTTTVKEKLGVPYPLKN